MITLSLKETFASFLIGRESTAESKYAAPSNVTTLQMGRVGYLVSMPIWGLLALLLDVDLEPGKTPDI